MREAAQVFLGYGLLLVGSALWRLGPFERAFPDVVALSAIYLGLTARRQVAPAVLGAVIIGYLADLLFGSPRGLLATTAGLICLIGHFVQGRLIVRGRLFALVFSAIVGLVAGLLVLILRAASGMAGAVGGSLVTLLASALLTGLLGPAFFFLARRVDARFARTQRERDAALEGLAP